MAPDSTSAPDGPSAPGGSTAPGRAAREALADTLEHADPHARTLCAGWDVAHLAAHVVLRDSRPDVALGTILGGVLPLAQGYVDRKLDATADRTPYPDLVADVRRGPALSLTRVPAVDDAVNATEFAVHRADVRRAQPGWEADPGQGTTAAVDAALWANLKTVGKLAARKLPGPLVAVTPDGRRTQLRAGDGEPVVMTGTPLEVVLFLFGRDEVAQVELTGPADRVSRVRQAGRGL